MKCSKFIKNKTPDYTIVMELDKKEKEVLAKVGLEQIKNDQEKLIEYAVNYILKQYIKIGDQK